MQRDGPWAIKQKRLLALCQAIHWFRSQQRSPFCASSGRAAHAHDPERPSMRDDAT